MPDAPYERFYRGSLLLALTFQFVHALTLPLLMTFDGAEYLRLSDVILTARFPAEWDFARTPLYPLLLKVSIAIAGRGPLAAVLPNILFGALGIWAMAASLRQLGFGRIGAVAALLLSAYPTLVTYQHSILTEAGTFFFLALPIRLLIWSPANTNWKTAALAATLIGAYYHRPPLLYLAPIVAALHCGPALLEFRRKRRENPAIARPFAARGAIGVAAVLLIPWLASIPWKRALDASPRRDFGNSVLLYGLLKQAVVPPGDPILGDLAPAYDHAIASSGTPQGRTDFGGLTLGTHWPVYVAVAAAHDPEGGRIFFATIRSQPKRYAKGVLRTLLLFGGMPTIDSESSTYVHGVITDAENGSKFHLPPERVAEVAPHFTQKTSRSLLSRALNRAIGPYELFVFLGVVASVVGFFAGCWRRDARLLTFTAIPLAYLSMHALILLASDRHAVPAWPIALANLLLCPAVIFERRESNIPTSETKMGGPDDIRVSEANKRLLH